LPAIALDTEFMRSSTFYPNLALIQVSDGVNCWLIDPLTISDWQALALVLKNPNLLKIMHSGVEDVEVLQQVCRVLPQNIFDTQIAASFLNLGFSLGLAKLVKNLLNIELNKTQTLTNWRMRPLTAEQVQYAAEDAFYCYQLYLNLIKQLNNQENKNKLNWVLEESLNTNLNIKEDKFYLNISNKWQLNDQQLAVLYDLYLMREQLAKDKNLPLNWVLKNEDLYNLALHMPLNVEDLNRISSFINLKNYDGYILTCINKTIKNDISLYLPYINKPLNLKQRTKLKSIKKQIVILANKLKIDQQIITPKHILIDAVRYNKIPSSLIGYKKELLQDIILKELNR